MGILTDNKLKYHKHIENINTISHKELDILKILAFGSKGAHPKFLMNVYKALLRPKLDYESTLYKNLSIKEVKNIEIN